MGAPEMCAKNFIANPCCQTWNVWLLESSVLGSTDVIVAEVEKVVDLIVS
jgi:hypothetical protein